MMTYEYPVRDAVRGFAFSLYLSLFIHSCIPRTLHCFVFLSFIYFLVIGKMTIALFEFVTFS